MNHIRDLDFEGDQLTDLNDAPVEPVAAPVDETPSLWVDSIEFTNQQLVELKRDDIVVIVGPNNSGKSATVRNVHTHISNNKAQTLIVKEVRLGYSGTPAGVIDWVPQVARLIEGGPNPRFMARGYEFHLSTIVEHWQRPDRQVGGLANIFTSLLQTSDRLTAVNPAPAFPAAREAPRLPIQTLYSDESLEAEVSARFREAFGVDLIVHRSAGDSIPLYTGDRPSLQDGQLPTSSDYSRQIEKLPALHQQGDGMKAFGAIVLNATLGYESVVLIDEPEAFLHPPQARLLARVLATDLRRQRQVFVATHSGDVVRGLLDANPRRVRVLRITRVGDRPQIRELPRGDVTRLWSESLLRQSNILDGLFHDLVVVSESDSDARFYSAVADTVQQAMPAGSKRVDVMFTHCGNGKDRMPMVVRALRSAGVQVVATPDFDILRAEKPLRTLVGAAGGDWSAIADDWRTAKNALDVLDAPFERPTFVSRLIDVVQTIAGVDDLKQVRTRVNALFKGATPWATAKAKGVSSISTEPAASALKRILGSLTEWGIRVVPVGELEGFVPSNTMHGPRWAAEVLERDLQNDPEFLPAREFVAALIGLGSR